MISDQIMILRCNCGRIMSNIWRKLEWSASAHHSLIIMISHQIPIGLKLTVRSTLTLLLKWIKKKTLFIRMNNCVHFLSFLECRFPLFVSKQINKKWKVVQQAFTLIQQYCMAWQIDSSRFVHFFGHYASYVCYAMLKSRVYTKTHLQLESSHIWSLTDTHTL